MSVCPKCGTAVPESAFGLFTCEQCQSVLNIDFNGNVDFGSEAVGQEPLFEAPQTSANMMTENSEPYELPPKAEVESSNDFQDVVEFGNSSLSTGNQGHFLYDVLIKGIDSEDLHVAVREALIDSRFGWKGEDVFSKLRAGTLLLSRLNAVKASVLINRLKSYPLEISWVQNGLYEVDPQN